MVSTLLGLYIAFNVIDLLASGLLIAGTVKVFHYLCDVICNTAIQFLVFFRSQLFSACLKFIDKPYLI